MKRILCIISLITSVIIIYSCKDSYELIGDWDDNIKLSAKTASFDANPDSVIITTKGDSWWILGVMVNNESFGVDEAIDNRASDKYSIKEDCFVVERRDKNTLFIKVDANPTNVKRIITIHLQAGDYFDSITITQASK